MAAFLLFSHWALSIDVIGASLYCYLPVLQIGSANTGGSASPSDDSSSDDSSKDGTGSFPVTHDAASIAGSIRSMEARPLHLQKSDSMYSTDESRFSSFSEELEPLDLTHLNIRASIMCMVSRVQHLAGAEESKSAVPAEALLEPLTPCSTPGELSPWAAELMPSVRKLRQSMACLHKVARITYALLSLKVRGPTTFYGCFWAKAVSETTWKIGACCLNITPHYIP